MRQHQTFLGQGGRRIGLAIGSVFVLAVAAVSAFLHFYPWQNFASNARLLGEVGYCLGFFDTTRAEYIRGRVGDGANELPWMEEFAQYYAQMLRKFEVTGSDFGQTVQAGRKDAHEALETDLLNLLVLFRTREQDRTKMSMPNWQRIANRCRAWRDQARDRLAARPDRFVSVPPSSGTNGLIALCSCEGMLRANYNAMNENALSALKALTPRLEQARRDLGESCRTAAFDSQQAIEQFPVPFLRSQGLLDHCYALSMAPQ